MSYQLNRYYTCFLFLLFVYYTIDASAQTKAISCVAFYKKTHFNSLLINKNSIIDVVDNDDSTFKILYTDGNTQKMLLIYKNLMGLSLKSYLKPGFLIKKEKNNSSVSVAQIYNKHMDVRVFNLECE